MPILSYTPGLKGTESIRVIMRTELLTKIISTAATVAWSLKIQGWHGTLSGTDRESVKVLTGALWISPSDYPENRLPLRVMHPKGCPELKLRNLGSCGLYWGTIAWGLLLKTNKNPVGMYRRKFEELNLRLDRSSICNIFSWWNVWAQGEFH